MNQAIIVWYCNLTRNEAQKFCWLFVSWFCFFSVLLWIMMGLEVYKLCLPDSSARWSPLRFCKEEILGGNWMKGRAIAATPIQWHWWWLKGAEPALCSQPECGLWVPSQCVSSFSSLNAATSSHWFLQLYFSLSFALSYHLTLWWMFVCMSVSPLIYVG